MKTEIILYRQQLLENPRFANITDYGWSTTGTWSVSSGHITKTSGNVGTLYQESLLTHGVRYKLRFRMYGRSTGTLTVTNRSGGTVHLSTTTNDIHIVEFTADGTDIIFNVTNVFNGSISQASLTQLPETYNLDLREDVSVPLTFDIDDIFNASKRKAPGSKTIEFPGTHNNNLAFNQVYKINSDSLFNVNLKSRTLIKQSGLTVLDADLCLDKIIKNFTNNGVGTPVYKTQAIGRLISIIELLKDYTVADLDFSEYNHLYDLNKIYGSWNDDIVINGAPSQPNMIHSYTSPNISTYTTVVIDGFNHPKITFVGAHNLSVGDEVFVPIGTDFSGDQTVYEVPSSTEITLKCTKDSSFSGALSGIVTQKMLAGFGYWYPSCDYGTIQDTLIFDQFSGVQLEVGTTYIIYNYQAPDDFTNVGALANATGEVFVATGTTPTAWLNSSIVKCEHYSGLTNKTGLPYADHRSTNVSWFVEDFIPHIFLREVFQKMMEFIGISYDLPFEDEKWYRRIIMPLDQDKFRYDEEFLVEEGDVITMNDMLPKIKLTDVFMTVVNMANLAVIQDNDIPEKVNFVYRNTFFDNTPIDWTEKLDVSKGLEIDMLNKDLPKTYHLKYKDSTDYYNLGYNREFGNQSPTDGPPNPIDRKYGDKYLQVRSDFLKNSNKIELAFEPTVLGMNTLTDMITSKCFHQDLDEETNGSGLSPFEGLAERRYAPRLLFAGIRGALGTYGFNLFTENPSYQGAQQFNLEYYPYAGHIANIDDIYPDWDLNFDTPLGTYLQRATSPYTERPPGGLLNIDDPNWGKNNLYNLRWKRYLEGVTDPNARLVTGWFKLSVLDIYNLDFSIPVRVYDHVLKLNKVIDWNVNGSGICKCEFLLKTI